MSRDPTRQFAAQRFGNKKTRALGCSKELLRGRSIVFCSFRFGIETNHPRFINRIGKIVQRVRRLRRQCFAIQEHRLVLRKKGKIVDQRNQSVIADFRIGRISVFDIDLAFGQGAVAERVIDAENLSRRQLIPRTQWPPSVVAVT